MDKLTRDEIEKMTVEQRLALIDALWDTIEPTDRPSPPPTAAQRAELVRRLDTIERDEVQASTWKDVRARLQQRRPY
jgi:putative addiction module component (TIGR02574 family)